MTKKSFLFVSVLLFCVSIISAQKSAFTIEDIYKIKNVGSQVVSHDGTMIAFTVTTSDLHKSKSNTDIYIMNADGSNMKQLTTSPRQITTRFGI